MKCRFRDIHILLGSLLIFIGVVSIVHGIKKTHQENVGGLGTLSPKDAFWQLSLLIASRSVEKIAESLSDVVPEKAQAIVQEIIQDEQSTLTRNDELELIFALALQYPNQLKEQALFFDLIAKNKDLYVGGAPILFIAAKSDYQRVVPALLEWAQIHKKELLDELSKETLLYIIKYNKFQEFVRLYDYGLLLAPEQATELLWQAVNNNNSAQFVLFLVDVGADINYVYKNRYTSLIRATELNNYDVVKAILNAIKQRSKNKKAMIRAVNMIPDPAVGSALQIAVRNQFGKIDLLLREYGARE
ncbi:ankyrin repeat domain-containing protein [Candidatus Dependentiae bacterium]|nr:ankyrin repeat domain-containing protein [Candidatus Dependentiae bacterium]